MQVKDYWEPTRPGYILTGYTWDGIPIWEIDPAQQEVETTIVEWLNPLEQPAAGTGGLDAGLVGYLGQSEAQKEAYELERAGLLESVQGVTDSLAEQIAKQANVQSGGYGTGSVVSQAQNNGASPMPILIIFSLIWYFG